MKEASMGQNVEVLEVKDNTILIKQNGYSKNTGQDLNGVLVLERINIRKKKKSCNKRNARSTKNTPVVTTQCQIRAFMMT